MFGGATAFSQEKSSDLLFYIDRNLNKNRVVYVANYDAEGKLKKDNPIKAHWIMYENNGESEALNYVEKKLAYGVECIRENQKMQYHIELVADKTRTFLLKQIAPFKSQITTVVDGITVKLSKLFIEADNSLYWPKVDYILIEGRELSTLKLISKRYTPSK